MRTFIKVVVILVTIAFANLWYEALYFFINAKIPSSVIMVGVLTLIGVAIGALHLLSSILIDRKPNNHPPQP